MSLRSINRAPGAAAASPGSGDIEGVTAGSGLTGGGTSGTVSLAVDHATATPAKASSAGAVGVSTKSARQDHEHPLRCRYNVGPWNNDNIVQSGTTNMGRCGLGTSDNFWVPMRDGQITALSCDASANVTAGSITFQVTIDGVAQTAAGSVLTITSSAPARYKHVVLSTPISVTAGQRVGLQSVQSADLTPNSTLDPIVDIEFTEA